MSTEIELPQCTTVGNAAPVSDTGAATGAVVRDEGAVVESHYRGGIDC